MKSNKSNKNSWLIVTVVMIIISIFCSLYSIENKLIKNIYKNIDVPFITTFITSIIGLIIIFKVKLLSKDYRYRILSLIVFIILLLWIFSVIVQVIMKMIGLLLL